MSVSKPNSSTGAAINPFSVAMTMPPVTSQTRPVSMPMTTTPSTIAMTTPSASVKGNGNSVSQGMDWRLKDRQVFNNRLQTGLNAEVVPKMAKGVTRDGTVATVVERMDSTSCDKDEEIVVDGELEVVSMLF